MGRLLTLVIALAALWLLLSGYFDNRLLLTFGALTVAFATWMAKRAGALDDEGVPIVVMPGIFIYWLWLFLEIGKANVIVAREALAIRPKLSPRMVFVPAAPRTDVGKATFANSITLTPGTVSVDLFGADILVHGLTDELADVAAMEEMGARVARIEHVGEGAPRKDEGGEARA